MLNVSSQVRSAQFSLPIANAMISGYTSDNVETECVSSDIEGKWTLRSRRVATIKVCAHGFHCKTYPLKSVPTVVRLLERKLAVYLDRPSARPGEVIKAHIHAPYGCTAKLIRIDGKRGSSEENSYDFGKIPATECTVPDDLLVSSGLNWPAVSFTIPSGQSGIWALETRDKFNVSSAPLVIKSNINSARPKILVLASVATWVCYNAWGGRNRYRNYENADTVEFASNKPLTCRQLISRTIAIILPELPRTKIKRFFGLDTTKKGWVSYWLNWHRPWGDILGLNYTVDAPVLNHLAALDVKILSWLDKEGFEYECVADLDLEFDKSLCKGRKVAILMGHSEYWSSNMYQNLLEEHTNNGMWTLNLSGNSIYRKIEIDTNWSLRLSEIVFRLGGQDETVITGGRYSDISYGTAVPFKVIAPRHWIYEGINLPEDGLFGRKCLISDSATYENGYRPERPTTKNQQLNGCGAAGFEVDRLADTGKKLFTIIAKGDRLFSAHMAIKEPTGNVGGSFSVCSINFGGSLLVDEVCSSITKNVLQRALK